MHANFNIVYLILFFSQINNAYLFLYLSICSLAWNKFWNAIKTVGECEPFEKMFAGPFEPALIRLRKLLFRKPTIKMMNFMNLFSNTWKWLSLFQLKFPINKSFETSLRGFKNFWCVLPLSVFLLVTSVNPTLLQNPC